MTCVTPYSIKTHVQLLPYICVQHRRSDTLQGFLIGGCGDKINLNLQLYQAGLGFFFFFFRIDLIFTVYVP